MNDSIHLAQYVFKADSQLLGAFRSHPGPLGQLRGGRPLLYYAPPPPPASQRSAAAAAAGMEEQQAQAQQAQQRPCAHPPWLPCPEFGSLPAAALARRVAIWPLTADGQAPPEGLLSQLDGLVLAGSGTGSLPAGVVEALAGPTRGGSSGRDDGGEAGSRGADASGSPWTARLPIVISSRCTWGSNHDDSLYRGSLAKYEGRGFVLRGGYEHLNPLQARALLVLRLAAFGGA